MSTFIDSIKENAEGIAEAAISHQKIVDKLPIATGAKQTIVYDVLWTTHYTLQVTIEFSFDVFITIKGTGVEISFVRKYIDFDTPEAVVQAFREGIGDQIAWMSRLIDKE